MKRWVSWAYFEKDSQSVVSAPRKGLPTFTLYMDVCVHIYWIFFICYSRVCYSPLLKSQGRGSHFHCPNHVSSLPVAYINRVDEDISALPVAGGLEKVLLLTHHIRCHFPVLLTFKPSRGCHDRRQGRCWVDPATRRPLPGQILAQDDALNGPSRWNPVPVPLGLRQNEFDVHYNYAVINIMLQTYPQKKWDPVQNAFLHVFQRKTHMGRRSK